MTNFSEMGLSAPLLKALAAEGYETPTPIQRQAIPIALSGRDLIGLAQTGTGKTAAFALPTLHRLSEARRHAGAKACRVLVLAPTRELAIQIAESFRAYGRFIGLSTALAYGGASIVRQKEALFRGVDVLVATPGRLIDLAGQRAVRLDKVETLILDEADHMLDIGFIHALNRIAEMVPSERQTLFFSATMPPAIEQLAARFLTTPERIAVTPVASTAERVEQVVIHVDHARKADLLNDLLTEASISRAIVFTRTKHGADRLVRRLESCGHRVEAIHGNKSQGQRQRALESFKTGRARLLVATEIAARGIDVDAVSHVINYDLPNVPEQYVHRIGRTARAGAGGSAISFCAPDEAAFLRDIEKLTRQPVEVVAHPLGLAAPPNPARTRPPGRPQQRQGGRPPQRNSEHPRHPPRADGPRADQRRDEPNRQPPRAKPKRRDDDARQAGGRAGGQQGQPGPGQVIWSNREGGASRGPRRDRGQR